MYTGNNDYSSYLTLIVFQRQQYILSIKKGFESEVIRFSFK